MKILRWLFLLLAVVAGIGFYRGWFSLSTRFGEVENREVDVKLTVSGEKMEADADAVKDKVQELTGEVKEKSSQLIQPTTEKSPTER